MGRGRGWDGTAGAAATFAALLPYLDLDVAHFGGGSNDRATHHGGKDVLGEVGASKAALDKLRKTHGMNQSNEFLLMV